MKTITEAIINQASELTGRVLTNRQGCMQHKCIKPIKRYGEWGKRAGRKGYDFIPFMGYKINSSNQIIFIY